MRSLAPLLAGAGLLLPVAADASAGPVFRITDPRITESSGLVDLGPVMLTVNDSGHPGQVFVLDARSGVTVGVTDFGPRPVDAEAMAPLSDREVWVGDTGGNTVRRTSVVVYRVPFGRGTRTVTDAPHFELRYPDGPHDAEALFTGPGGRLFLITKSLLGGTVYAAPRTLEPGRPAALRKVGRVSGFVTDAASFPDHRQVIVRGYGSASVYTLPGLAPLGTFRLPTQRQGEGISVGPDQRVRISSEGTGEPVLQVRLPTEVVAAMRAGPVRSATPEAATRSSTSEPSTSTPSTSVREPGSRASRDLVARPVVAGLTGAAVLLVAGVGLGLRRWRRR